MPAMFCGRLFAEAFLQQLHACLYNIRYCDVVGLSVIYNGIVCLAVQCYCIHISFSFLAAKLQLYRNIATECVSSFIYWFESAIIM